MTHSKLDEQINKVFEDYQLGNATLLSEAGIRAAKQALLEAFEQSLPKPITHDKGFDL